MTDEQLVDAIQKVREQNNKHWMGIVKLALEHAPRETKKLLSAIRENDIEVSDLTGELANEDRQQIYRR